MGIIIAWHRALYEAWRFSKGVTIRVVRPLPIGSARRCCSCFQCLEARLLPPSTAPSWCGAMLGPGGAVSCPSCHALVHAARLKAIAATAQAAQTAGDLGTALGAWREAEVLLPFGTKQRLQVEAQIKALSSQVDVAAVPAGTRRAKGGKGPLAGAGAAILVLASKAGSCSLLRARQAADAALDGRLLWRRLLEHLGLEVRAPGLVAAIYVHEMGHVWELRKFVAAGERADVHSRLRRAGATEGAPVERLRGCAHRARGAVGGAWRGGDRWRA